MANETLRAELRVLRRGRGVRRPKPDRWIGPELRELVESAQGPATGEDLRTNLIAQLRKATTVLTKDQVILYQAALGATDLEGLLTDRLARMEKHFGRDYRTLQRWLSDCDELVAARLLHDEQMRQAEDQVMRRGWTLIQFSSHLLLNLPRPEYRATRTIQVTSSELTVVSDVFSMPEPGPGQLLEVEAGRGCTLREVEQLSSSMWRAHLELPRPLHKGETWELSNTVRVSSPRQVPPYVVLAPARPCAAFRVRVDVGDSGATDFAKLDGVPLPMVQDPLLSGTPLELRDGTVTYTQTDLQTGLAYGLRWRWAD